MGEVFFHFIGINGLHIKAGNESMQCQRKTSSYDQRSITSNIIACSLKENLRLKSAIFQQSYISNVKFVEFFPLVSCFCEKNMLKVELFLLLQPFHCGLKNKISSLL